MKWAAPPETGDIIRYKYKGEWEYARWNGDGTRTLLGDHLPQRVFVLIKYYIEGVWKKQEFHPRKLHRL